MAADSCISRTLGTGEGTLRLGDPEVLVNLVVADSEDDRILGKWLLVPGGHVLGCMSRNMHNKRRGNSPL